MRELLSGNEAIARGAYEGGVKVASAYPGTPSTEILENLPQYDRIKSEWAPNEKVALEVAIGASIGGARSLSAMKHVGVNVAADPLLTAGYTGVSGGLVLISADDPEMHSSQNEQDNRYYSLLAKVPMLEPSDSQEAKDFMMLGLEISEQFDTPLILRLTTRVAHSKGLVELNEPQEMIVKEYKKDPAKYVMTPAYARGRHVVVEDRRVALTKYAGTTKTNRIEMGNTDVGYITSGISYQYIKEIFPQASILKLGMLWPLNEELIKSFASKVDKVIIVEELEPVLETQIKAMGIVCEGKNIIPRRGELSEEILRQILVGQNIEKYYSTQQDLPIRPPILCPGCSHRGMFYTIKKMDLTVAGDIGCYALGSAPPFGAIDAIVCMGASIGMTWGMEKAQGSEFAKKTVGILGDSTFFHTGINGLIELVYNKAHSTIIVLDNSITAMTGHQDNPGTGRDLLGMPAPAIKIEDICQAVGIKRIRIVDPFDLPLTQKILQEELNSSEVSVIIARRPCALVAGVKNPPYFVDSEKCIGCKVCIKLGCPAISVNNKKAAVDPLVCVGCGLCPQVCPKNAIKKAGDK